MREVKENEWFYVLTNFLVSPEKFMKFYQKISHFPRYYFAEISRKPNRNFNFLVKLYTIMKNMAGFLSFYKWTLVFSN